MRPCSSRFASIPSDRVGLIGQAMTTILKLPTRNFAPSSPLLGLVASAPQGGRYEFREDGLWYTKGDFELPISNFRAVIEEPADGAECAASEQGCFNNACALECLSDNDCQSTPGYGGFQCDLADFTCQL